MERASQSGWLAINYAATVFVSAFLLFLVQPLISKSILPWFGGSPAVWTTAMLFFQSALLVGYAYAHFANRRLPLRWQGLAQLGLLAIAVGLAWIEPNTAWKPTDGSSPVLRILLLLAACVGMPYFVLATTGPLMQAWFSRHYPGRSPYRLYALSNLGSFIALLSYPLWFEPRFALRTQTSLWFWGYVAFVALTAAIAWQLLLLSRRTLGTPDPRVAEIEIPPDAGGETPPSEPRSRPAVWRYLLWLLLPMFASMVLLATTNQVCQNVAPAPFLWVIPLSIYLLTFIIAFDHPRWYRRGWYAWGAILTIFAVGVLHDQEPGSIEIFNVGKTGHLAQLAADVGAWGANAIDYGGSDDWRSLPQARVQIRFVTALACHFLALFCICMLCHGELVRLRPTAHHLTAYYLTISAGGALGGLFVSIVAPLIFTTFFEWKIGLVVGYVLALLLVGSGYVPRFAAAAAASPSRRANLAVALGLLPLVVAALVGLPDLCHFLQVRRSLHYAARNFYGVVRVHADSVSNPDEATHVFVSGNIKHGIQFTAPGRQRQPTAYFGRHSGVGRALTHYSRADRAVRVGIVGLGAGTLATYARPGDHYCFYEINPMVIEIARDERYFTFLSTCRGQQSTVLGDARLSLERADPQHYDVLVLDAFSGDSVPKHLLTAEAFEIYHRHLTTRSQEGIDGTIAVNITNRHLDLLPVVKASAERLKLAWIEVRSAADIDQQLFASRWVVLTRNERLLAELAPSAATDRRDVASILWTDDHSDLWRILIR